MSSMTETLRMRHAGVVDAGGARKNNVRQAGRPGLLERIARKILQGANRHPHSLQYRADTRELCWNPAGSRRIADSRYRHPLRAKEENLELGWNALGNHWGV